MVLAKYRMENIVFQIAIIPYQQIVTLLVRLVTTVLLNLVYLVMIILVSMQPRNVLATLLSIVMVLKIFLKLNASHVIELA